MWQSICHNAQYNVKKSQGPIWNNFSEKFKNERRKLRKIFEMKFDENFFLRNSGRLLEKNLKRLRENIRKKILDNLREKEFPGHSQSIFGKLFYLSYIKIVTNAALPAIQRNTKRLAFPRKLELYGLLIC